MQPVVPLWDPDSFDDVSFERYEPFYPALFLALRAGGWSERRAEPISEATYARVRALTWDCYYGDQLLQQFGGLSARVKPVGELGRYIDHRDVRFAVDGALTQLLDGTGLYDVLDEALGTREVYPVAETEGHVLFVSRRGEAALIEQSLVGYMVGDNPFSVLSRFLLGEHHADVRVVTLREGY